MHEYLHNYITDFFVIYLPNQRCYSNNTIISYKYTFILFLEFIKTKYKLNINKLLINDLNKNIVNEFINFLTTEKNNSISTTNQRLCAIHSFCKYLQKKDIKYFSMTSEILNIETKKKIEKEMYYLNKKEIKSLLDVFDVNNINQLRDYAIISVLYDSGARVQELIDLVSSDINFESRTIKLHGKGSKIRIIPISSYVVETLKKYFKKFKISINTNELVFFNSRRIKLTREGIKYILKKYAKLANLNADKITPHVFRHTKAMHLLENNVNLVYIRDFLGHTSVTTTEIYAKANPEVKRKAIENLSNEILEEKKYSDDKKEELIEWLRTTL